MSEKKHHYFQYIDKAKNFLISTNIIIGRGDDANIIISDDLISSKHLEVKIKDDHVVIKDLNTSNGTLINEDKAKPGKNYVLKEWDKVKIGSATLIYAREKYEQVKEAESNNSFANVREFEISDESVEFDFEKPVEYAAKATFGVDPEQELLHHRQKMEQLDLDLKEIEEKMVLKDELTKELEEINTVNDELLAKEYDLKKAYKQHGERYEELKGMVDVLTKQLEEAQGAIKKLGPQMQEYQKMMEIKDRKASIVSQVKSLTRRNLPQKKIDKENEIVEAKEHKKHLKKKVNEKLLAQAKEKEAEKEKIREEIKKLQEKLDKV